jgi:superfamily I DNA/RNA helicase
VDVPSRSGDGHFIPEQGRVALSLFDAVLSLDHNHGQLFDEHNRANVFIIAPFKDVAEAMQRRLEERQIERVADVCGTVHTFQGKESDVVILLLGGDLKTPGAISGFAAAEPNLLNVALTRAKRRIYVVGQRDQWAKHAFYRLLARELPTLSVEQMLARCSREKQ